jgi:hypothetical protein
VLLRSCRRMMTVRLSASRSVDVERALGCLKERAFQMVHRLQQRICALQGHNLLLQFETNRLSLRCANCGWHTPGWSIAGGADARASLIRRSWATSQGLRPLMSPRSPTAGCQYFSARAARAGDRHADHHENTPHATSRIAVQGLTTPHRLSSAIRPDEHIHE